MADNYGIKIAKAGFDVKSFLTELNKKNFNILSTEDTLLRKEVSSSSSNTRMFLGYVHVTTREEYDPELGEWVVNEKDEIRPLNYFSYSDTYEPIHIIYENLMP